MDARGVVTSINRADRAVNVVMDTGETVEATYLGTPPWPLSTVALDGDLTYLCLGPIGDRRVLVRDDFMIPTTADSVTTATVTSDIAWGFSATGTGSTDAFGNPGAGCGGARRLLAPSSSSARIRGQNNAINAPSDGYGVWFSARARINGDFVSNESAAFRLGLGNSNVTDAGAASATDVGAHILYAAAGSSLVYRTTKGTSSTSNTSDYTPVADTWFWVDIVAISGEWAAFWVDGSGPYVNDTNVPLDTDEGYQPFAFVSCLAGNTCHLLLDLIEVQLVNPVLHATDYALETEPAQH